MSQQIIPKIDVLMTIIKRLDAGEKLSTVDLSRELSVTERTIYRYLDTLQSAGYPIYIDCLKAINVTYGHSAGDEALRAVSRSCRTLGRSGADEFVIVLTGEDAATSVPIAERLRKQIEALPIAWKDTVIRCTASIGVATLADSDPDGDALLARAEQAAYKANRLGKNQVVIYDAEGGSEI